MDYRTKRLLEDFRSPDELSADEVRARLQARANHPAEYLAAQERREALRRDEADRAAAKDVWLRHGGDPKSFTRGQIAARRACRHHWSAGRSHICPGARRRRGLKNRAADPVSYGMDIRPHTPEMGRDRSKPRPTTSTHPGQITLPGRGVNDPLASPQTREDRS